MTQASTADTVSCSRRWICWRHRSHLAKQAAHCFHCMKRPLWRLCFHVTRLIESEDTDKSNEAGMIRNCLNVCVFWTKRLTVWSNVCTFKITPQSWSNQTISPQRFNPWGPKHQIETMQSYLNASHHLAQGGQTWELPSTSKQILAVSNTTQCSQALFFPFHALTLPLSTNCYNWHRLCQFKFQNDNWQFRMWVLMAIKSNDTTVK